MEFQSEQDERENVSGFVELYSVLDSHHKGASHRGLSLALYARVRTNSLMKDVRFPVASYDQTVGK